MANTNILSTLTTAVNNRLTTGFATLNTPGTGPLTAGIAILTEDEHDLATKISEAVDKTGMLVLIGMPSFINEALFNPQTNAKITFAVVVAELPITWRDAAGLNPHCLDVVQYVTQLLAQFQIAGFQKLRVQDAKFFQDKKRLIYGISIETMATLNPLP